MNGELVELGDICEFTYGDGLREDRRRPGPVPVYGSNGIVGWHDQAITHGPTIIIGRKGSIGEVNFSPVACFPIDTTYYVETTKKPSDLRWLYYALIALELTELNKSAAVPGLNREDAYEKKIRFPPLPGQHRIAGILDRADRLRRMRRYAQQMTGTFLQAVFVRMFGDPISNPLRFGIERLEHLIDPVRPVTYGIVLPGDHIEGGVPYVRVVDMKDRQIDVAGLRRTAVAIAESYKRSSLKPGDLLLSIRGQVGRLAIVPASLDGANITQDTARLATTKRINVFYLMGCLGCTEMQEYMRNLIKGAAIQGINLGDVKEFPIPIPPLTLQETFARIVQRFERLRAQQREAERQAEQLFQALLQRAFSGGL